MLIQQSPWILVAAIPFLTLLIILEVKTRRERSGQAERLEQQEQQKEGR